MQLKENTLYRMRDGRVVGPLIVRDNHAMWYGTTYPYHTLAGIPMWKLNGRWDAFMDVVDGGTGNDPKFDIVEEVSDATL
jgi:hypothetical protein